MKSSMFGKLEKKRLERLTKQFDQTIGDITHQENALIQANIRAGNISGASDATSKITRLRQIAHLVTGWRRYGYQAKREGIPRTVLIARHRAAMKQITDRVKQADQKYEQEPTTERAPQEPQSSREAS